MSTQIYDTLKKIHADLDARLPLLIGYTAEDIQRVIDAYLESQIHEVSIGGHPFKIWVSKFCPEGKVILLQKDKTVIVDLGKES